MMKKDKRIITNPMIAKVSVFLAPSTAFGSPLDVMSLIPEMRMKKRATTPAKSSAARTRFSKTTGTHFSVATVSTIHPGSDSHFLNKSID